MIVQDPLGRGNKKQKAVLILAHWQHNLGPLTQKSSGSVMWKRVTGNLKWSRKLKWSREAREKSPVHPTSVTGRTANYRPQLKRRTLHLLQGISQPATQPKRNHHRPELLLLSKELWFQTTPPNFLLHKLTFLSFICGTCLRQVAGPKWQFSATHE